MSTLFDNLGVLLAITLYGLIGGGWVLNLQNLFQYDSHSMEFVFSLIGVAVFPMGIVLGWAW